MSEATMTGAPTTAPATPTTTTETSSPRPDLNQRAAAIVAQLDAIPEQGGSSEGGNEDQVSAGGEGATTQAGIPDQKEAPNSPAPDARSRATTERQARIAKMRAKEAAELQQRVQRGQQTKDHKEQAAEVGRLRARLQELEPLNNVFADEATLLSAAEKKGMTADKLIAWMRQRISDPAAVAERQAKTVEEKLAAQIAEQNKKIADLEAKQVAEKKQAEEQRYAQQRALSFLDQAEKANETHPLSAALLKRHGPQGLIAFANTFIAPLLGEEYELQDLHDHMEQFLDEIQVGASPSTDPSKAPSHAKKNGAAQQPGMTLSNSLTSERATVTETVPLHRLSLKERERLLIEQLERE